MWSRRQRRWDQAVQRTAISVWATTPFQSRSPANPIPREKMTMFRFGSICLVTGVLCAAGGALAADPVKKQVIPNFATTDKTGWVLDHAFGVDDLLPPPTGGPGPVTFDKAHPYVPNNFGAKSTYRVGDLSNPILRSWTIPSMKK